MYLKMVLRGSLFLLLNAVLVGLFGYLLRIFLARSLSVSDFGLFYAVITVFIFFSTFLDIGLSLAVSKKIIELKAKQAFNKINNLLFSVIVFQLLISIILVLLIILFSGFLSTSYFHADAHVLLYLLAIWLITVPFVTIYSCVFYGFQRIDMFSALDVSKALLVLLLSAFFFYFGYNIVSPAIAYILTSFILLIVFYFIVKKIFTQFSLFSAKWDKKLIVDVLKFGVAVSITNFIWLLLVQTDTLVLTYFTSTTQVGFYQVAILISNLILFLANAVSGAIFPVLSDLYIKKKQLLVSEGISMMYKYISLLVVPFVVLVFIFPDIVINIVFTSKFLGAVDALRILAVCALFTSFTTINNAALNALGKPLRVAQTMGVIAVLNIILLFILVPKYGLVGAAISTTISFVLASILSSYQLKKQVSFKYPIFEWIILLFTSIGLIFLTNWLRAIITLSMWPKLILILAVFGILYLSILFIFRILKIEEIKGLIANLKF
jgi:stage V sporulation protein B